VNECHQNTKDNLEYVDQELCTTWFVEARTKRFESLDENTESVWESKCCSHLLRKIQIKDKIVTALKKNPKTSWWHIEKEINRWCCNSTILKVDHIKGGLQNVCQVHHSFVQQLPALEAS
jgi:hypothetical protein